jgi:hypothetical protein
MEFTTYLAVLSQMSQKQRLEAKPEVVLLREWSALF